MQAPPNLEISHVGNLGAEATERDIRCIFEKHGTVDRLKMMMDRQTGQPRGFAFVEMAEDADAGRAIVALNGTELNGRVIHVNAARPQLYRSSGHGRSQ